MNEFLHYLCDLYHGITFTKIETREDYSIYAAKIQSSHPPPRGNYILVTVPNKTAILREAHLSDLVVTSLSLRYLEKGYPLTSQKIQIPRLPSITFREIERDTEKVKYAPEGFEDEVELLVKNNPKKQGTYQYGKHLYWPKFIWEWPQATFAFGVIPPPTIQNHPLHPPVRTTPYSRPANDDGLIYL